MPILAKADKKSLARAGVAIVNVGGLAFGPFAHLFGPGRLPYRCAIVSDADPPKQKDNSDEVDSADQSLDPSDRPDPILSTTAQKLFV